MKFPRRHADRLFAVFMAASMSGIMSLLLTLLNVGTRAIPWQWLHNWGIAFVIALPCILLLAPIGRRLVTKITE